MSTITAPADIKSDLTLDAKGLSCPMPILRIKKEIGKLKAGEVLEVLGTDPGTRNDLPGWCEKGGHTFLGEKEGAGCLHFYIKKG